jgi:predicted ATP-dependent Lon-type protease
LTEERDVAFTGRRSVAGARSTLRGAHELAQTLLLPVSARRQLNELPDDLWTKINIEYYKDAADAVFKALVE